MQIHEIKVVEVLNYKEIVDYIEEIPKFTSKNPLDHTKELLKRLGNPQNTMKVIHVAGTNGKGSVCAYLDSMLRNGGYHVGLFTSPHLVKINERFKIDGVMVTDEEFIKAFEAVREIILQAQQDGLDHPSYFETLFLMCMVIFQKKQVDYVVLETGLGGRLDATNTVDRPLACIITSISKDHVEYLGNTIAEIAGEKAGIIKPGVPVIYDGKNPEAAEVIRKRAAELGSPSFALTDEMYEMVKNTRQGIDFSFRCQYDKTVSLSIPYIAAYQMMNASLAFFTMKQLQEEHGIPMEQLIEGPRKSGLLATIPSETKLITITVVDGVCYVNLDEMFLNQNQEISEPVVLYSIVDSLTELTGIDKVQISINGDTSGKCRYTYKLSKMYKADDRLVTKESDEKVESTE